MHGSALYDELNNPENKEMQRPLLSIVIVNYNTKDDCIKCIQSIQKEVTGIAYEIILCDNGSSDGSKDAINEKFPAAQFPWLHIIDNKENIGFGKANNRGTLSAGGEIIYYLNPDTAIGKGTAPMCRYLLQHEDIGILGPVVYDKNRRMNILYSPIDTNLAFQIINLFITPLAKVYMALHKYRQRYYVKKEKVMYTDYISGCAIMVRKDVIQEISGFDESLFLYGEEFDLCMKIKMHDYRIGLFPAAEIIHYGGSSSRKTPTAKIRTITEQSYQYLMRKYFPHTWRMRYRMKMLTHKRQIIGSYISAVWYYCLHKDYKDALASAQNHSVHYRTMADVLRKPSTPGN